MRFEPKLLDSAESVATTVALPQHTKPIKRKVQHCIFFSKKFMQSLSQGDPLMIISHLRNLSTIFHALDSTSLNNTIAIQKILAQISPSR